jgi:hypothetical protein
MVDDRASSLRMTSRRLHHALFLTSLLAGCYASSGAPEDAGTSRPDASVALDAPRGAAQCGEAALLALDTTEAIDVTQAIVPELGSCWSGDEAYVFRRIEVPPLTGVEIRTEGADAPVVHLHEECSLGDGDRCVRFGPSGFFSPGEPVRTTYYGNPERTARSLYVAFWWVGEGETPFRVITRSSPVAEHGACDRPEPLAPNDLVTAGSARGGTYESWSCWYLPESHFYDVALPGMHVAVPLEGSHAVSVDPAARGVWRRRVHESGALRAHRLEPARDVPERVRRAAHADPRGGLRAWRNCAARAPPFRQRRGEFPAFGAPQGRRGACTGRCSS